MGLKKVVAKKKNPKKEHNTSIEEQRIKALHTD